MLKIKIFKYDFRNPYTDKNGFENEVNEFIAVHNVVNHSEGGYKFGIILTLWYDDKET